MSDWEDYFSNDIEGAASAENYRRRVYGDAPMEHLRPRLLTCGKCREVIYIQTKHVCEEVVDEGDSSK